MAAADADPARRAAWQYFSAASLAGGAGATLAVVWSLTAFGALPALLLAVAAMALLLAGLVRIATFALRGTRPDGLLDALACSIVVISLAPR